MITFLRNANAKQLVAIAALAIAFNAAVWWWVLTYASQETKASFFWPFY